MKIWFYMAAANADDEFFSYECKAMLEDNVQEYLDKRLAKLAMATKIYAWPIRASEMRPRFFEKPLVARLPY